MKIPGILAVLFLASSACLAQDTALGPCSNTLHNFLTTTKNTAVKKETLATFRGTLGPGQPGQPREKAKAVFTVIVARDTANPGSAAAGIEVQFSLQPPKRNSSVTIYLDQDTLPDFLRGLGQTIRAREHPSKYFPQGEGNEGTSASAFGPVPWTLPCYPVMDAGWQRSGAGISLWIEAHPADRSYLFPGVSVEQLEQVICAAQAYIAANTPRLLQ